MDTDIDVSSILRDDSAMITGRIGVLRQGMGFRPVVVAIRVKETDAIVVVQVLPKRVHGLHVSVDRRTFRQVPEVLKVGYIAINISLRDIRPKKENVGHNVQVLRISDLDRIKNKGGVSKVDILLTQRMRT